MEKIYENGEFDKVMEKYNFDSPIEVTLVIEEEDPPEPLLLTDPIVSSNRNVPNTNIYRNTSEVYKRINSNNSKPTEEVSNNSNSVFSEGHQEETQDMQWKLLDAVADNLIHITKCFYHNFVNSKKQNDNNKRLTSEYLTFKHYFFNLSYSTTITILLPRENDIIFLNKFIYRIVKIANRSSWFQITHKMLKNLIHEMLTWTKKKKTNLELKFGSNNHEQGEIDCSSSALTISSRLNESNQNLNRFSNNGPITNQEMRGASIQPDIVSKTHLPVQTINISPNIRHITNCSTNELNSPPNISTRTNYPVQDANNPISSNYTGSNAKSKRTKIVQNNRPETFHSQPEIYISPYFIPRLSASNQGASIPCNIDRRISKLTQGNIEHSTKTITSNYNIEPKTNNFRSCQAINTNKNKIILSSGPPNREITISVDSEILANINIQNTIQLNNKAIEGQVNEEIATKRRKTNDISYYPYSNFNSLPHHNENIFHYNKNESSTTNLKSPVDELFYDNSRKTGHELLNTDTLRSSISRDSGCDSPIYGSFRNEYTIETPINKEQETPIISHVTSMNPNAVHLNFGFCKVCGATTNNVCIGCYQKYYCSFLCQKNDWENHKYICSRQVLL